MNQDVNHDLLAFVPSLTRHARYLAGSGQTAAEQVRICLELLAAQPERLSGKDTRAALFRAFHDLWSPGRVDLSNDTVISFPGRAATEAPCRHEELEICIFQLVSVERFSPKRVAEILSIDERQIAEILVSRQSRADLPVHASVLIIEDDALMAKHMNEVTQDLGLTVIHVADSVENAVCAALNQRPTIILIDLQLRRGESGLTAARGILLRRRVPVIFVTGYPWMLETEDDLDPAFVVAKPFRTAKLKARITRALDIYSEPDRAEVHHAQLLTKVRDLLRVQAMPGEQGPH